MDFLGAQRMWAYNEAAIELAAAGFFKRLQQNGHELIRDETELLRRKIYKIRLDSFLSLS